MSEFLIAVTFLILLMASFILLMVYNYQKRQMVFHESFKKVQDDYEKNLIQTQLEIQEQTFQHISREIHDNISLSLTLAKLQLNTFDWNDRERSGLKLESSISLIGNSIAELSDISKSLNADIIAQNGLLRAIEEELERIRQTGLFGIRYELTGSPVYMDSQRELIIFRIIQEALNNVIKHAGAKEVVLTLDYHPNRLEIRISDNGRGFDPERIRGNGHAGLKNMETRAKILMGEMQIDSSPHAGTCLIFTIPIE
ncbi:MAG: ATP-binding protein [Sphingobacteriales bacterium]|nr:ATP-binding protein [Sphingobacteriales bacterium]